MCVILLAYLSFNWVWLFSFLFILEVYKVEGASLSSVVGNTLHELSFLSMCYCELHLRKLCQDGGGTFGNLVKIESTYVGDGRQNKKLKSLRTLVKHGNMIVWTFHSVILRKIAFYGPLVVREKYVCARPRSWFREKQECVERFYSSEALSFVPCTREMEELCMLKKSRGCQSHALLRTKSLWWTVCKSYILQYAAETWYAKKKDLDISSMPIRNPQPHFSGQFKDRKNCFHYTCEVLKTWKSFSWLETCV